MKKIVCPTDFSELEQRVPEGLASRAQVLLCDPADQIVQAAADEKADLVFIATRGQTGFKRLVFGSGAEKTVRLVSRPVLTIPARSIGADR